MACAVISLRMASAPMKSPVRYRPEPVLPAAVTTTRSPTSPWISEMPRWMASSGRPAVGR